MMKESNSGNDTRYYMKYMMKIIIFYALANRYNNNNFGEYDHFTIYFDTDPQSDVTKFILDNGSTKLTGVNWDETIQLYQ